MFRAFNGKKDIVPVARHGRARPCILMSSHILGNVDDMCDEVLYIADAKILSCSERSGEVYERLYLS